MPSRDLSGEESNSPQSWRRSSRSWGNGNCLEISAMSRNVIMIRDSKDPHGPILRVTPTQWDNFLDDIRCAGLT